MWKPIVVLISTLYYSQVECGSITCSHRIGKKFHASLEHNPVMEVELSAQKKLVFGICETIYGDALAYIQDVLTDEKTIIAEPKLGVRWKPFYTTKQKKKDKSKPDGASMIFKSTFNKDIKKRWIFQENFVCGDNETPIIQKVSSNFVTQRVRLTLKHRSACLNDFFTLQNFYSSNKYWLLPFVLIGSLLFGLFGTVSLPLLSCFSGGITGFVLALWLFLTIMVGKGVVVGKHHASKFTIFLRIFLSVILSGLFALGTSFIALRFFSKSIYYINNMSGLFSSLIIIEFFDALIYKLPRWFKFIFEFAIMISVMVGMTKMTNRFKINSVRFATSMLAAYGAVLSIGHLANTFPPIANLPVFISSKFTGRYYGKGNALSTLLSFFLFFIFASLFSTFQIWFDKKQQQRLLNSSTIKFPFMSNPQVKEAVENTLGEYTTNNNENSPLPEDIEQKIKELEAEAV